MVTFCLSNVQKTLTLQRIIALLRFLVIGLMIYGASYYIVVDHDVNRDVVMFDMDYFGFLIGNVVLSFMWHHCMPNVVRPIRPEKKIKKAIISANLVALLIFTAILGTAVIAFGGLTNSCEQGYPCML